MKKPQIVENYWNRDDKPLMRPSELAKKEQARKKKRIRQLTPKQIVEKQRYIHEFSGCFLESFGKPEKHCKWFITGPSYSGKSSFVFQLCEYLTEFGKIDYNNHEEAGGDSDTVAVKLRNAGLTDSKKVRFYKADIESEEYETFLERLMKRGSADFAILDSMQHAGLNKRTYLELTTQLCTPRKKKNLIFISHWIKNDFTKFVKHDCDVKIEVKGFVAKVESRCTDALNKPFLIWEEGAKRFWGKKYKQVLQGKFWK